MLVKVRKLKQNIYGMFSATLLLLFHLPPCSRPLFSLIFVSWLTSPAPLLPLTLDAKTMNPAWSQLHLLLNVPFWVLLLMLTRPLDIFSWNSWVNPSSWARSCPRLVNRLFTWPWVSNLSKAISCGWRRALGRGVEKRSCVSDMAKADPSADDPSFLVFNVDNPSVLAE